VSAATDTTGQFVDTVWSSAVTGTTSNGLTLTKNGVGDALTYVSGSGTTTLRHSVAVVVLNGNTLLLSYSGTGLTPSPASFSNAAVTNNVPASPPPP
jgi:hypothetical protein